MNIGRINPNNSSFDQYGKPKTLGQISPFTDPPIKQVDPLQVAIAGGQESGQASAAPMAPQHYQNIPGFEETRLNNAADNDPKTIFGRFAAQKGGHLTGDDVRAFVANDPRWEIDPNSHPDDPHIRVKQDVLNTWKPGQSIYQNVIQDSGPGGQNLATFQNAEGGETPLARAIAQGKPPANGSALYSALRYPTTPNTQMMSSTMQNLRMNPELQALFQKFGLS